MFGWQQCLFYDGALHMNSIDSEKPVLCSDHLKFSQVESVGLRISFPVEEIKWYDKKHWKTGSLQVWK